MSFAAGAAGTRVNIKESLQALYAMVYNHMISGARDSYIEDRR